MTESKETISNRKRDHIDLAFKAQQQKDDLDKRFYYEPVLQPHPKIIDWEIQFGVKKMKLPIWVSSMTGGTDWAKTINTRLAEACAKFGMGMGLGSCRSIIDHPELAADFDVRSIIGPQPLFGNLGIAQVEEMLKSGTIDNVKRLIDTLQLDGLIVHINPLQEWMQPEGDLIQTSPIDTIEQLLENISYPLIVKEVGQGMGPKSLSALLQLPLLAIEFGASGGTNFALLELLRSTDSITQAQQPLVNLGHTAEEMVDFCNSIASQTTVKCQHLIISGGLKSFLDGYYLMSKSNLPAIYGQASAFLKHATESSESLFEFCEAQAKGLALCKSYLSLRT